MLSGKVIITTRQKDVRDSIADELVNKGAEVLRFPMIEIEYTSSDENELTTRLLSDYSWIICTSRNGVKALLKEVENTTVGILTAQFAAMGSGTADEFSKADYRVSFIPKEKHTPGFINEFIPLLTELDSVLLIQGEKADDRIENAVSEICTVRKAVLYRTVKPAAFDAGTAERIKSGKYDIILFSSPSAFLHFKSYFPDIITMSSFKSACIGPTTRKIMQENGCEPVVTAASPDAAGVILSLQTYFTQECT
jgi:uroporphyrinogen-III synthase